MNDRTDAEAWAEREACYLDPTTAAIELLQRDIKRLEAQIKELQARPYYQPKEN